MTIANLRNLRYNHFRVRNKPSNKITHRLNQGNTKQPFGLFGKSKSSVSGEIISKCFLRFHSRVGALPWKVIRTSSWRSIGSHHQMMMN